VRAVAEVTAGIRHDTVFLPFHYAGTECANLLTASSVDPVSAMPEFKRTPVTVRAVPGPVVTVPAVPGRAVPGGGAARG
jgi:assimilatory nitrate reductase catalytic subunit